MDNREKSFSRKFRDAARSLGVSPDQVSSLKLRENVHSQAYHELLQALDREFGLQHSRVDGEFQGQPHLLSDGKTKVIIVEHETGLEILYIAGSIASLIGLIPLVLQCWRAIQSYSVGRDRMDFGLRGAEIRQFDKNGHLREEHIHDMPVASAMGVFQPVLAAAARAMESDTKEIMKRLAALTLRVDALETQLANVTELAKRPSRKKGTKRPARKA